VSVVDAYFFFEAVFFFAAGFFAAFFAGFFAAFFAVDFFAAALFVDLAIVVSPNDRLRSVSRAQAIKSAIVA
jgi:hypothetical protein